jgi:C_GCAxxG_C_C family probable redox protein
MYNKEAHEKAADAAMKLLGLRSPLRLGEPPSFVDALCSEPVIEVLQPLCPLKWDRLVDVTIGLGAGISYMGELCGALSGAIICIGLDLAGRYRDTAVLRFLAIQFTQKLMRDFAKEFGAVRCKELLGGMDISGALIPDDENFAAYRKAKKEGTLKSCKGMIRWAIMYPLPSEQEDLHPPL